MDVINIRTGDQFLIRSDTILSKGIREFMKLRAKHKGIKITDNDIYSHAGFFIRSGPRLMISEAVENGYKIRDFDRYYNLNMDCCIMRLQQLPDEKESELMIQEAYRLQEINWGYQYWNFLQWIHLILFRINLFKNSDQWLYCFEGNYRIYNAGRPWSFTNNPEITDIFQLFDLSRFKSFIKH